jgi:ABC-type glycerol-3-phosphate transport system substrate-binding protein
MKNKQKIESIFIFAVFMISAIYIAQTSPAISKADKASQGVVLKVLVSDQQVADIEMWKQHIIDNSGGAISDVDVVSTASRADDQFTQLQTIFTTGSTDFDVVAMDVIWPAGFADQLVDLSDIFNSSFRDTIIQAHAESMVWDGKVIAGPYFFDSGLVLYRKDILERNGLTIADFKTWSSWKTNLNKILDNATEALLNPSLEGYVFQGDAYEGGIVNLVEWMGASGGSFVNNEGKSNFAASAEPALTWMKSLVAPIYNNPLNNPDGDFVSSRSELIGDEGSAVTKWLAGNAVFQRNWPFSQASSANDKYLNGSQVLKFVNGTSYNANVVADPWFVSHPNEDRFGVTTLPYNATICGANNQNGCRSAVLGGAVLGIPSTSTHISAAKLFLKEIASKPFQLAQAINGTGNTPVLKEIYTDGSLNSTSQEFKNELYKTVYQNVLPRPVHPDYVQMSQSIQPLYHNGFSGALPIKEALQEMDSQVNLILGFGPDTNPTTATATVTNETTKTVSTPAFEVLMVMMSFISLGYIAKIKKFKRKF